MRYARIARLSRRIACLAVMLAAASLFAASAAGAADIKDFVTKLPRAYLGEFQWDGDKTVQNVVITFDRVNALNEQNAEAFGCGSYEVNRQVTTIKIRMFVRVPDRQVEILELSPEGNGSFETNGSHRGALSDDLQQIDAQWTSTTSGQHGQLHLRATSSAACEPAASM
jgi:hypothetical protein